MRIAQVAPLFESVPPKSYGGTERIVSYLTEELVELGHDVTLFASGDSVTQAELVPCCTRSLRLDDACVDRLAHHVAMLEQVLSRSGEFDIIHYHIDYMHYPASKRSRVAHVTTLHGRLDIPDLVPLYYAYLDIPVVSISNAQRQPLPWLRWEATVHHGLPEDLYTIGEGGGGYLAFVGRISPEKRVDRAIEIARRCSLPLKIAAKVDRADRDYFEVRIRPLLNQRGIEFLGEIDDRAKGDLLGGARAMLFPIDWPEPFGLVMLEAMACGTPVIAWRHGSVPEVIEEGVTGHIVDPRGGDDEDAAIDEAAEAVENAGAIDRCACRAAFEDRFTARRMAQDYVAVYHRLLGNGTPAPSTSMLRTAP